MSVFHSPRGIALIFQRKVDVPVLTVENYIKWYELFLVEPDGTIKTVSFDEELDEMFHGSTYCDHVPNPKYVRALADQREWTVDEVSFDAIVGRWAIEYHESVQIPESMC